MTTENKIKDLMQMASNAKHLLDELNRRHYGLTMEEALRVGKCSGCWKCCGKEKKCPEQNSTNLE